MPFNASTRGSFGVQGKLGRLKKIVSGGSLTSDATYYYRTFNSSSTLEVLNGPIAVTIVVQGGGGAGHGGVSGVNYGSAGAGGINSTSNHTLNPGQYNLVIGAGGTGAFSTIGTSGSSSSFSSLSTATGGNPGQRSGGTGGSNSLYSGAYNGGYYGGGGAGAGGNASGPNPGSGVLNLDGIRRGGGGGAVNAHTAITLGVDGGGAGWGGSYSGTQSPVDGTANRGGGGGGTSASYAANGGSGIIIVRYLKTEVD